MDFSVEMGFVFFSVPSAPVEEFIVIVLEFISRSYLCIIGLTHTPLYITCLPQDNPFCGSERKRK